MVINGQLVVFLLIALVGYVLALSRKGWVGTIIFFIIALGATNIVAGIVGLDVGWVLLVSVALFLSVGIPTLRNKDAGNKVLGILLTLVGVLLVIPAVNTLGSTTPGTIWAAVVDSFQQGGTTFFETLQSVFGET